MLPVSKTYQHPVSPYNFCMGHIPQVFYVYTVEFRKKCPPPPPVLQKKWPPEINGILKNYPKG